MNNCLLSICIPTYNRLFKLKQQIDCLLSLDDPRFEIVVSDNQSTDGTIEYLKSINNTKLKVLHQDSVSSARNITNALINADGDFALLLLDKDSLSIEGLPEILDYLSNTTAKAGFCRLDIKEREGEGCAFLEPSESFPKNAYLCRHPSGYFYHSKEMKIELEDSEELIQKEFPFIWDVVFTHMASKYDTLIVKIPFMSSESDYEGTKIKSLTYNVNNLWFSPEQVTNRYLFFLNDLGTISLSDELKNKTRYKLMRDCFRNSTIQYAWVLSNHDLCLHYGIPNTRLSVKNMFKIAQSVYNKLKMSGYNKWLYRLLLYTRLRIMYYSLSP